MAFFITSGKIAQGVLYIVLGGSATVTYNGITYNEGNTFRGVLGMTIFTITNSAIVQEVLEIIASCIEYTTNGIDKPAVFSDDATALRGFAVELELTSAERIVNDVTALKGFGIELIDYPFYSFSITETRL